MASSRNFNRSSAWERIDLHITSVDLTQDHQLNWQVMNDLVICLDSDSSFDRSSTASTSAGTAKGKRVVKGKTGPPSIKATKKKSITPKKKKKSGTLGDCPICLDPLGKNQLASTKCGHVFCFKCLERALQSEKKCPTCRRSMKSCNSYHPLYIGASEELKK